MAASTRHGCGNSWEFTSYTVSSKQREQTQNGTSLNSQNPLLWHTSSIMATPLCLPKQGLQMGTKYSNAQECGRHLIQMWICLLISDRESMKTRIDNTNVQIDKPKNFTGVTCRNTDEELITGQKQYKHSYITKTQPSMGDSLQSWNLIVLYITCKQLNRLENILSR